MMAACMNETAGYSETPLARKLGIKAGIRVVSISAPDDYEQLLAPIPEGAFITNRLERTESFIHLFVTTRAKLEKEFPRLVNRLEASGSLWVSWPKKSSGIAADVDENVVREVGLRSGMVDVKVCAVDHIWSGLKFVRRLRDR